MKTILITGTSRGIGLELTKQYYQEDWHVIACLRDLMHAAVFNNFISADRKGKITPVLLDINHPESIQKLSQQLSSISIDILFNNAGAMAASHKELEKVKSAPWLDVFKVNTIAPLLLVQSLLPQIAKSELKIIANMSSLMGSMQDNAEGSYYIYRSSKAALNSVTKSLSIDLKKQDITVVSLHPGWVKTDMGGPHAHITPEESVKGLRKVLHSLSLKDSGSFLDYTGKKLSW